MPTPLVKLIVALLLIAQAWLGFARGETICIKWGTCTWHETLPSCSHAEGEHQHVHSQAEINIPCSELAAFAGHHLHSPLVAIQLDQPACGCHLHIPSPSDRPVHPSSRAQLPEPRELFVPLVVAILRWNSVPPVLPNTAACLDDARAAPSRTLLTTRLLI
jgi:hypothetical protein